MRKPLRLRGHSRLSALLALVILVVVVVVVVGLLRGWFQFSVSQHEEDDRVDMQMSVHRQRIAEDADEVVDRTRQLAQSAAVVADVESVEGTVVAIDQAAGELRVRTEDGELTMNIEETVEVRAEDGDKKAHIDSLQPGDSVVVAYHDSDQGKQVMRITILNETTAR